MAWSWEGALAGFADPSYGAQALLARQKAEAEAEQRQSMLQTFGLGSPLQQMGQQNMQPPPDAVDSHLARLGAAYTMTGDSRFLDQIAQYQSPDAELDRTIKRAQIENSQGQNWLQKYDIEQKRREMENRQRLFGTGQPDFGPSYQPTPSPSAGIQVDNFGARNESLGIPNPAQLASQMQSMIGGNASGIPVETTQLQPPPAPAPAVTPAAQPAPTPTPPTAQPQAQRKYESLQQWTQTPEGQDALAGLGQEGAIKRFYELQDNENKQLLANLPQVQKQQENQQAKSTFTGALSEIKTLYDQMMQEGTIPSAKQNIVGRTLTGASSAVLSPEKRQTLDGLLSRLRLSLMQATGMSSQVFNSNTEMQSLMKALSSPENTYEANVNIINSLDKQYGSGQLAQQQGQNAQEPRRYRYNPRTGRIE